LLEGLGDQADTVLRAAVREFFEPEATLENDERAERFETTRWMRTVAVRELRLSYVEDLNRRFETRNAMEQGPAHEMLDTDTVVAAFEQFLNPIHWNELLALALPVREMWATREAQHLRVRSAHQLAELALRVGALPATKAREEGLNKHLRRIIRACWAMRLSTPG
jgi:hypothetical protein